MSTASTRLAGLLVLALAPYGRPATTAGRRGALAARSSSLASTARARAPVRASSAASEPAARDVAAAAGGAAASPPLFLVDALPLVYRGYYGIRGPPSRGEVTTLATSAGEESTAIYGFASQLAALLVEHGQPARLVVVMDGRHGSLVRKTKVRLLTDALGVEIAAAAQAPPPAAGAPALAPLGVAAWRAVSDRLAPADPAAAQLQLDATVAAMQAGGRTDEPAPATPRGEAAADDAAADERALARQALRDVSRQVSRFCDALDTALPALARAEPAVAQPLASTSVAPSPASLRLQAEALLNCESLAAFPAYKSTRASAPASIAQACAPIGALLRAAGIPFLRPALAEADDAIATLAAAELARGGSVVVVSPDKDFRQLLCARLSLLRPRAATQGAARFQAYTHLDFAAEMDGLAPAAFCDYAALVGDSVDDVPGVPGVGPVTAARLLRAHGGSLEALLGAAARARHALADADAATAAPAARKPRATAAAARKAAAAEGAAEPEPAAAAATATVAPKRPASRGGDKALETVANHAATALLCKQLVQLDTAVALPAGWAAPEALRRRRPDVAAAMQIFERYELRQKRILDALLAEPRDE
jgi:5'-3' exonuclease